MIGIVYSDESEATSFLKTVNKKKAAIGKILHSSLPPPSILRIASPHSRSAYDALTGGTAGYLITGHVQMQVCEAWHPSLETCFILGQYVCYGTVTGCTRLSYGRAVNFGHVFE